MLGLLKSIGLDSAQEKYHWGGDDSSGKRNYYCPVGGCTTPTSQKPLGNRLTLQAKRDQLGGPGQPQDVERNPSFVYHATVEYGGRSFDPSYGIEEGEVKFLTAVRVPSVGEPQCVRGETAATALRVTRNSFGEERLAFNNDTNKVCTPAMSSIYSGAKLFRFDSLGGADIAIINPSTGEWLIQDESQDVTMLPPLEFKPSVDALVPGDFDGDGVTDPGVWYSTGDFYYRSSVNYYKVVPSYWRTKSADEKAVPGDYDGDRLTDLASWRGSDGKWIIRRSSDEATIEIPWGGASFGDVPVPGDYDGDGKTDIAVWRPDTGTWWVLKSSDGNPFIAQWGMSGDIAVQGDYDGDGTTDLAVVRPTTGVWYFLESENGYQFRSYPGPIIQNDDQPVPADYNADSRTDVAVWAGSSGMWQIVNSQTGEIRQEYFGSDAYIPVVSTTIYR